MSGKSEKDQIRSQCWVFAQYACGTSYIFNRRALSLKRKIGILKFMGIAVPITIGAVAAGFGVKSEFLMSIMPIAAFLTVIQLIISAWAVISNWDNELAYCFESQSENSAIADEFESLAQYPDGEITLYKQKFDKSKIKYQAREAQDNKHTITDKETRMGMRYCLRNYQKTCVGCKTIPTSMSPSDCKICGNF